MQALVLVGGEGTRLRPLTETIPKPVLPLVGRPFLAYMVEWLGRHGVSEVILACGFLANDVRDVLGDGEPGGPRLRYLIEPEPRGTAGAIKFAESDLEDRFLALNGDVLSDLDLTALVREHEQRNALATIGLYPVEDSSAYGVVVHDDGEVSAFLEKPEAGQAGPGEINAGCYVLERELLERVAPDRAVSIERDLFPRLVGNGLRALPLDGYWLDIGTPDRYLQASWDILEGRVETSVSAGSEGSVALASGASIADDAAIGPRAVISTGCRIGSRATITSSVLLADCTVGEGAVIDGAILGPRCVVEARARVAPGTVLGEGAIVKTS